MADDYNTPPDGLLPGTRRASIGFAAAVDSFHENQLDLNEHLIHHPAATFFVRAQGNAMIGAGIHSGDLLIVDRAIVSYDNRVVVAIINGEFIVRRLRRRNRHLLLVAEQDNHPPIRIEEGTGCDIWGVVTAVIHRV